MNRITRSRRRPRPHAHRVMSRPPHPRPKSSPVNARQVSAYHHHRQSNSTSRHWPIWPRNWRNCAARSRCSRCGWTRRRKSERRWRWRFAHCKGTETEPTETNTWRDIMPLLCVTLPYITNDTTTITPTTLKSSLGVSSFYYSLTPFLSFSSTRIFKKTKTNTHTIGTNHDRSRDNPYFLREQLHIHVHAFLT